jgi:DNA-binding FadR family transcriptional regulator
MSDFAYSVVMNETELRRLSELRALLEGFAARHAATRAASAPETLDHMRLVLRRLSKAARARDYPAFRQADFELHEAMIHLAAVPSTQGRLGRYSTTFFEPTWSRSWFQPCQAGRISPAEYSRAWSA